MKAFLVVVLIVTQVACASYSPLSYQETCGVKGMVLKGVSSGTSSGVGVVSSGAIVSTSGYSEQVSCEVPKGEVEMCESDLGYRSAVPKLAYNDRVGTANNLIGIGYILYIVPGAVFAVVMSNQKSKAEAESNQIRRNAPACDRASASVK